MADVKIKATSQGPYQVTGDVEILDSEGNLVRDSEGVDLWMCRCGHSKNKPFCDGTHKENPFEE